MSGIEIDFYEDITDFTSILTDMIIRTPHQSGKGVDLLYLEKTAFGILAMELKQLVKNTQLFQL